MADMAAAYGGAKRSAVAPASLSPRASDVATVEPDMAGQPRYRPRGGMDGKEAERETGAGGGGGRASNIEKGNSDILVYEEADTEEVGGQLKRAPRRASIEQKWR